MLEGASAWSIVSGDEKKLNDATTATTHIQDWDKRENKVKFLLKMFVKDNIIPHIRDGKSSIDICRTLKNLYQTQNTDRILSLKCKLFSMRMEENESVVEFIARVKDLKDILGDIGEMVSDFDLVTITLNRMTDEYHMFITGMYAWDKSPAFEELTRMFLQEEER